MSLEVIHQIQVFSNASRLHLFSTLQDFNWHARVARSLGDSWASCSVRDYALYWPYSLLLLLQSSLALVPLL